jgi:hypothetical protein
MTLLAVAVLVRRSRVRCLARDTVVTQQRLIPRRELLCRAARVHRHRQPIGPVPRRHAAEKRPGPLQSFTEACEALRETDRHVFPVRPREHVVMQQVIESLTADRHAEAVHSSEVRRSQPARLVLLLEEDLLRRPVLRLPLPNAPLQRTPSRGPRLTRMLALKPVEERFCRQTRLTLEHLLQLRPDADERIRPSAIRSSSASSVSRSVSRTVWSVRIEWRHWTLLGVFASRFAVHSRKHGRSLERRTRCPKATQLVDLRIGHRSATSHEQLLRGEAAQGTRRNPDIRSVGKANCRWLGKVN